MAVISICIHHSALTMLWVDTPNHMTSSESECDGLTDRMDYEDDRHDGMCNHKT